MIKSMQNQDCKRFLGVINKVDRRNISLHYISGGKFYSKYFDTLKNNI